MSQTSGGYLLMYRLGVRPDQKGLYEQVDSPVLSLRRDSAELFLQESIPPLLLTLVRETFLIFLNINVFHKPFLIASKAFQIN